MRALATLALLLAACGGPGPAVATPTPTREPGTLEVTALLDLSGNRFPRGDAQRNAIQFWTDQQQARAGTPRLRVRIVDVGGSDARLLIELRRAVEDERADAVLVGTPAPPLGDALEVARVPALFTLPLAEPTGSPGGRWAFALAPTPDQLARYLIASLPGQPWQPFLLVLHEGRPVDPESAALLRARESAGNSVTFRWDRTKGDLAPTLRGLVTATSRVYLSGSPREYQGVAAGTRQVPSAVFASSWLADPADLGELRDTSLLAVWPTSRHLSPASRPTAVGAAEPTAVARRQFLQSYGERHGPPSAHAGAAFDALSLIATAAERSGRSDREGLRDGLESLQAAGIATTYSFSATRHAGFASEDLALARWTGSAPAPWTPTPAPTPAPLAPATPSPAPTR